MFKRFFSVLLIAVLSVFGLLVSTQADEGKPAAVIEKASHDFGSVYEGVDVIHDFVIRNKGDADLEVTDVKAG